MERQGAGLGVKIEWAVVTRWGGRPGGVGMMERLGDCAVEENRPASAMSQMGRKGARAQLGLREGTQMVVEGTTM